MAKIKAENKKPKDNVCQVLINGNEISFKDTLYEDESDNSSVDANDGDEKKSDFSQDSNLREKHLSKKSAKSSNSKTKPKSAKLFIGAEQSGRGLLSNRKLKMKAS